MKQAGIGRWGGRGAVVCALLIALSILAQPRDGDAQGSRQPRSDIGRLIERFDQLGESRPPFLRGAPRDLEAVRRGAAQGERLSPFGARELPLEMLAPRPPPIAFTDIELLLVNEFCRGDISEENERILRVMRKFSPLERDYCTRARETVLQFGYDLFDGEFTPEVLINGAIPEDYVLGIGDQLIVTFHGQESGTEFVFVDREGRVVLENMLPIPAAGRTFGEFRRELEARTATSFLGTDVFVSLGAVRLISVAVVGEVRKPGLHRLTGLSTVLDAIGLANGVKKTGSLRRIQVRRGDQIFWIDLYEILISGAVGQRLGLVDGDRIFVPPIGPTVAVAGKVKRAGIFELAEARAEITIADLLTYAGGPLRPQGNVFYHVAFDQSGREHIAEKLDPAASVMNGDIIVVHLREDVQLGAVELLGHVRVPGRRSLAAAPRVGALIGDANALMEDPYLLLAVLETTDPITRSRRLVPIDLQGVLTKQEDIPLQDNDRLIVLGAEDVRYLSSTDVQDILLGRPVPGLERERPGADALQGVTEQGTIPSEDSVREQRASALLEAFLEEGGGGRTRVIGREPQVEEEEAPRTAEEICAGLRSLAAIVSGSRKGRFANAIRAIDTESELAFTNRVPCPPLFDEFADLLPLLLEHVVAVSGEVRRPGAYPITPDTPLSSLIVVAGGLTRATDVVRIELSQFPSDPTIGPAAISRSLIDLRVPNAERTKIGPGDVIRFNPIFSDRDDGPVLLSGEFLRPGLFQIRRGETLSELIVRAGGLTEQAYPFGAVFTRERVKEAQQAGFDRAARSLSSSLAVLAARSGADPRAALAMQELSRQLQTAEALGRVVIEADPTVLQAHPELDTVLEPKDKLFMPKRPNFVSVTGDVLNPGALQFASGRKAQDYIGQAGGFQRFADRDRVFLVLPNGEARPLSFSFWNYSPVQIPPGSAIVVPKNPAPFDLVQVAKDFSQVFGQLAIGAASLAIVTRQSN